MFGNDYFLIFAVVLFLAFLGTQIAKRLNQPALVFYILAGILFSNLFSVAWFNQKTLVPFATLGVTLLLFTLGLELPLYRLIQSSRQLIRLALIQLLVNGLLILPVTLLIVGGSNWGLAVLLSIILSLSSTAVVTRLLQDSGQASGFEVDQTLGILIIQDLFSVVVMTFVFYLNKNGQPITAFLFPFGRSLLLSSLIFYFTAVSTNYVFRSYRLKTEALLLFIFATLFLLLWLFIKVGIPETMVGFLVGILLANRVEHYEIFSQIKFFRDLLVVVFFFVIGTYIQSINFSLIVWSLILTVLIMFIKLVGSWLAFNLLGFHNKVAYKLSFNLMQFGEFSFILFNLLYGKNLLDYRLYQIMLFNVIWSLLIYTSLYKSKLKIYYFLKHKLSFYLKITTHLSRLPTANISVEPQLSASGHAILCGYGRVGSFVGHALQLANLPIIVIETNYEQVIKLQNKGVRAIYGDASEPDILRLGDLTTARFLIITIPDLAEQEKIIFEARRVNPHLPIFSRSHQDKHYSQLKSLGIEYVFQPEFEAALSIVKRIFKITALNKEEIKKKIQYLKMEQHAL
jgi:CPA2 family monovalent cation:H+ antiporter-2